MDDSVFRSENTDYYSHQQPPRHHAHAGCCSALARAAASPNPTRIQRSTVLRNGHIPSASKQNKQSTGIASNPNPMPQPKQKRGIASVLTYLPPASHLPLPQQPKASLRILSRVSSARATPQIRNPVPIPILLLIPFRTLTFRFPPVKQSLPRRKRAFDSSPSDYPLHVPPATIADPPAATWSSDSPRLRAARSADSSCPAFPRWSPLGSTRRLPRASFSLHDPYQWSLTS